MCVYQLRHTGRCYGVIMRLSDLMFIPIRHGIMVLCWISIHKGVSRSEAMAVMICHAAIFFVTYSGKLTSIK